MAFTVTADPTTFDLDVSGAFQDVTFTYGGVTPDVTGTATVEFALGAETGTATLTFTLNHPDPTIVNITVDAGVTATVISNDETQAVIRFTRD